LSEKVPVDPHIVLRQRLGRCVDADEMDARRKIEGKGVSTSAVEHP